MRYPTLGAALTMLTLTPTPAAWANNIVVVDSDYNDGTSNTLCSLVEAIDNANDTLTGQPHSDCSPGDPDPNATDFILAIGNFVANEIHDDGADGPSALPLITSRIAIQGNAQIARSGPPMLSI